jgi:hypothetical protein
MSLNQPPPALVDHIERTRIKEDSQEEDEERRKVRGASKGEQTQQTPGSLRLRRKKKGVKPGNPQPTSQASTKGCLDHRPDSLVQCSPRMARGMGGHVSILAAII